MSYQTRKYRQAGLCVEKNHTAPAFNTSSDLCVFVKPPLIGNGIICNNVTCEFSGATTSDMLLSADTICFTGATGINCFTGMTWSIQLVENGTDYSDYPFSATTNLTGGSPTNGQVITGILSAYNQAGYTYDYDNGTLIIIDKPANVNTLSTELCVDIPINCGDIPNNANIYVFYDTSLSYQPYITPLSTSIRSWFNNLTATNPNYNGNLYELLSSSERWLAWATYPWSGTAVNYSFDTTSTWNSVRQLPDGALASDPLHAWSGQDKNAIVICMIDESAGSPAHYTTSSNTRVPTGSTYDYVIDTPPLGTQPSPNYTTDWNNFLGAHSNHDSFRGYVYGARSASGAPIANFHLQIYSAVEGGAVPLANFVESPFVATYPNGTLSAITFTNPYSALTGTNGSGLKNYGWSEKHDFLASSLIDTSQITNDFDTFISGSSGLQSECRICKELCFGNFEGFTGTPVEIRIGTGNKCIPIPYFSAATLGLTGTCPSIPLTAYASTNFSISNDIYEDGELVYSEIFFTGNAIELIAVDAVNGGFAPYRDSLFSGLTHLGYDYDVVSANTANTVFDIYKRNGVETLQLDICSQPTNTGATSGCSASCETVKVVNFNSNNALYTNEYNDFVIVSGDTPNLTLDICIEPEAPEALSGSIFYINIHQYLPNVGIFNPNYIYQSEQVPFSSMTINDNKYCYEFDIPVNGLDDGGYLIKGHFIYDMCTEFANRLGIKVNTGNFVTAVGNFGIYQDGFDNYMSIVRAAQTPILTNVIDQQAVQLNGFAVLSFVPNAGITDFSIESSIGQYIVSLNGIVLAENYDYNVITTTGQVTTNIVRLVSPTVSGDIITVAYVVGETSDNTLRNDIIDIQSAIPSGPTNGHGSSDVYYNTDTGKYEIYTSMTPTGNNDISVTLNGVLLANGIDYYQSTSDPTRIILQGALAVTDIINIYYLATTQFQGTVTTPFITVGWYIQNPSTDNVSQFTIEVSSAQTFTTLTTSSTINHVVGVNAYSAVVPITGAFGDILYYRVKNNKKYIDLCNQTVSSIAYSEVVPITVGTNLSQAY